MKFLIYGLLDPETLEIRYVGKSSSGLRRPKEHFKPVELKRDSYKSRWIRSLIRNGVTPEIVVLQTSDSHDDLYAIERAWVSKCLSALCRLTNLTDGGEGTHGYKHTDSTRRKLADLKRGKPGVKGMPSPFKGKRRGPVSDTHRQNMREAQQRIVSRPEDRLKRIDTLTLAREALKKPVVCSNGASYESIASAASELGLHKPNIIAVLKGKYKQTGGYSFRYGA